MTSLLGLAECLLGPKRKDIHRLVQNNNGADNPHFMLGHLTLQTCHCQNFI